MIGWIKQYKWEGILFLVLAIFILVQRLDLLKSLSVFFVYVIAILTLNDTFLLRGLRVGLKDIRREYLYTILLLIVLALFLIWNISIELIVFLTIFIAFAFYAWDSRITATAALLFLSSCPVFLFFKMDSYAEQVAVYAYYFLVITVILQMIEYKNNPELFEDSNNENN